MGTGLIFIGFLFLINPDLITLDVVPDFIGYYLISRGLSRLALLEERIAVARKWAHLLALTSVLKLFSCTIAFPTTIESTRLTVCFFFLVAEAWLSWLFCDNVFKGLHYLAIRKDGNLVLKSFDLVRKFTTSFFMVKAAANFLPQLPVIFFTEIDADGDQVENYTEMRSNFFTTRSVLYIIGVVVLVFLGIYTARIIHAYLQRCRQDESFCTGILSAYEENVVKNKPLQTRLAIKGAFYWFFLAFCCVGDLYLDFINMFPKPLFALFIFIGMRKLDSGSPALKVPRYQKLLTLISFVALLGTYGFRLMRLILLDGYFPYYFPEEILAVVATVINFLFSVLPLIFVFSSIGRCARVYTEQNYRTRGIVVLVLAVLIAVLSACQYLFVGRSDLVVFLEWGLYAVLLYLHKSSMDDVFAEAEYRLM